MKRQRQEDSSPIQTSSAADLNLQQFFRAPDEYSDQDLLGQMANPYNFRSWWNAIQTVPKSQFQQRALLYQRALHYLPGSYKIWFAYLKESKKSLKPLNPLDHPEHFEIVNELYEKSLVYMSKMPKIWLDYAKFLSKQHHLSRTRSVYDRCLKALPITQHSLVWSFYLEWACNLDNFTDTAKHVFQRYIEFKPESTEDFIEYLLKNDQLEDALDLYVQILQDEGFSSSKGKSRYQLWMELCEFIAKNPNRCNFEDGDLIIRHGIRNFTDEVGKLWIFLADYYTRQGLFGKTRDIFEEALATVTTARDFGIIFNAYMKFEEQMIDAENDEQEDSEEEEDEGVEAQIEALVDFTFKDLQNDQEQEMEEDEEEEDGEKEKFKFSKEDEVDLKYFRLENLIQRRPFLLSNTVLRQNQNNVYEWINRIKLCQDDPYLCVKTYTEAIATIDPKEAFGKCSQIWINFAQYYEQGEDLENANAIFHKATQLQFKSIDELANIYCQWGEMHVRHRNYESALIIMQHACSGNPQKMKKGQKNVQKEQVLYNNPKVWNFYIDLLENLSTFESTKVAYERLMDLRIATPQNILNYAQYLQKNNYFEESFRVYERAINLFSWPHIYEIWGSYLSKIIERYADKKLERIRDLFQQVLKHAPAKQAKLFFLMYADYEENFGLLNHAMQVYDRAVKEVEKEDRFELFNLYIAKAAEFYGVTKTRQLFERAFEVLSGLDLIEIGLRFAKLERKLGEIDRARAIYQHLSQFCNPRQREYEDKFWNIWEKFEVYHGNQDTYEDYLRTKRTVELRYAVANPTIQSDKPTQFMKEIKEIEEEGEKQVEVNN